MKSIEVLHYKAVWLFSIFAALFMLATSGTTFAATIGGSLYKGGQWPATSTTGVPNTPMLTGSDLTPGMADGKNAKIIIDGVKIKQIEVMVQDLETGDFVTYGTVAPGTNTWSANVAAPGNYLVMFMADGHDTTSREYHVLTQDAYQNAYLPPAPLPKANLLLYAFKDNYVNSEDDYPMDFALKCVKFIVKNDKGVTVATGLSGTQTLADMPVGAGPDINGLYFFTGLEPGDYEVTADMSGTPTCPIQISDPTTGTLVDASSSQWYQISSSEGTNVEDVTLYPGDPGTFAGGYWTWFAFVDKLGQLPQSAGAGSISGTLYDGDGIVGLAAAGENPNLWIPNGMGDKPWQNVVTINDRVPKGLLVLYPNIQTIGVVKPIATTEANPVTGEYTFSNVPPGNYVIFAIDIPLDYVWEQMQATVTPGAAVTGVDLLPMRWYARALGTVTSTVIDAASGLPISTPVPNAKVTMRIEDGTIWKETVTDADGKYLFDELPEVEVVGTVSVEPPAGYRAVIDTVNNFDLSSRTIQWYTLNHHADLQLEPIPATNGVIRGFVHNDNLELKPDALGNMVWSADGLYDEKKEKTFDGVTVELLDAAGHPVPALNSLGNPVLDTSGNPVYVTATTGGVSRAGLLSQHWIPPYTFAPPVWNSTLNTYVAGVPDEIGGVFKGTTVGKYEFRDLAPGDYQVRVVVPNGFSPVEPGGAKTVVALGGGSSARADLGIKTKVPLAGEIEGGIFDDLNLDTNIWSVMYGEKAAVPGTPLGVYDHLGYFLGAANMSRCYAGSTVCTACPVDSSLVDPVTLIPTGARFAPGTAGCPGVAVEPPEVGIRVASGPHIFVGNDPASPGAGGYDPYFDPLPWTYNFRQGSNKFEADWSLTTTAMAAADGGAMAGGPLGNDMITPQNQPVIISITLASAAPQGGTAVAQGSYFNMLALNNAGATTLTDAGSFQLALVTTTTISTAPVVLSITGRNFGDAQGYSTVTLSGVKMAVKSWSSNNIVVTIPVDAIKGALVVATSTGISNAMYPVLSYSATKEADMSSRSVFVDSKVTVSGNGSMASPYKTIGEALGKLPAVAGIRYVFVQPGTYNERIQIKQSNVALIGSGAKETIINANKPLNITSKGVTSNGPAIFIGKGGMTGALTKVTVSGFTIKGGSSGNESGGGIFGDYGNTSLDINTSIITQNGGEYGGGIWLHKSNHNVNIWSNTIASNGAVAGYGGGISVNDEPEYGPVIPYGTNEHTIDDAYPVLTTSYNIYNNLVIYNVSPDYGGGMSLYEAKDRLNIFGNVIMENKSYDHGGGIFFEDCGPVDLSGNVFMHNYAMDDGGAVGFEDVGDNSAIVRVYNNLFAENIADDNGENIARGGALSFDDTLRAEVFNNTIVGNIVAGTNNPRGGAIDSERHGHEYMNLSPAFSNVRVQNNIIWNNWRLDYDRVRTRGNGFGGHDYRMGANYRWTQDNLHVDNPAVQGEWASQNNSESFTVVNYNDISDGSYAGRTGNMNVDPGFVNPTAYNWRLVSGSPVANRAPATTSPLQDLERNRRIATGGFVEMGAYELLSPQPSIIMIPAIRNIIVMPKH